MPINTELQEEKRPISRVKFIAEAVSYRIPLAVYQVREYSHSGCYPICPRCGIGLEREYMSFCDRCGQRLSWHIFHLTQEEDSK